jgi:hypothetical protein
MGMSLRHEELISYKKIIQTFSEPFALEVISIPGYFKESELAELTLNRRSGRVNLIGLGDIDSFVSKKPLPLLFLEKIHIFI